MGSIRPRLGVALVVAVAGLLSAASLVAQPKKEAPASGQSTDEGLVIVAVDPGSPAEKAGLKRGDVVVKADKIQIVVPQDLQYYVSRLKSGDTVDLQLLRGGSRLAVTATLGDRSGRTYLGVNLEGGRGGGVAPRMGQGTPPGPLSGKFSVEALVGEVVAGSPAAVAGIAQGDAVLSVDGTALTAGGSLAGEIGKKKPGDKVTLEVRRSSGSVDKVEVTLAALADDATKAYLGVRYQEVPVSGGWGRMYGNRGRQGSPEGPAGLVVRDVAQGSPAEQAGIKIGEVITRVAGEDVTAATSLVDLVAKHKPGESVDLTVVSRPAGEERTVAVVLAARPDDKEKAYLGVVTGGRLREAPNAEQAVPRGRTWSMPRGNDA
jgi:S1-C subfamily serine protease